MIIKPLKISVIKVHLAFIALFFMFSCIEEYTIEVLEEYNGSIVVDGQINNKPGPYTITLSTSSTIEEAEFKPIENASIQIVDNEGNSESLTETEAGIYKTSQTGIQGVIGRSYKVIIQTVEGKNYESEFEELLAPTDIESVSYQTETRYSPNTEIDYEEGYQFYVTTKMSDKDINYFYWDLVETFEIHSTYVIKSMYKGSGWTSHTDKFKDPASPDSLFYCWKTMNDQVFTSSTKVFNTSQITDLPINFLPYQSEMLRYKYSVLVKQFTISENAHSYLKALLEQEDGLQGLYTKQPYQIQGNVFNKENLDEGVLGYFMVASISSETRVTVPKPRDLRSTWSMNCDVTDFEAPRGAVAIDQQYKRHPELWPIFIAEYVGSALDGTRIQFDFVPPVECIDCRTRGGVTKKPDYWDQ
jgi:hypothetical protein